MPNKVVYEWSLETLDENCDIIDSSFSDTPFEEVEANQRMCLVRNEGNEIDGLVGRLWAYVKNNKLSECFENEDGNATGYKVPKKYQSQLK